MAEERRVWVPQAVASAMLLWALSPANPYEYYVILRVVCCALFAYLALRATERGHTDWAFALGAVAVVYNPIWRVHLTREIWSVINVVTVGIAVASVYVLRRRTPIPRS